MKQGYLVYDQLTRRMDFECAIETYYGGLHCGESFEAYIHHKWEQVSIEYDRQSDHWYLPQHPLQELVGLLVRVK